jgi:hypothetical protein
MYNLGAMQKECQKRKREPHTCNAASVISAVKVQRCDMGAFVVDDVWHLIVRQLAECPQTLLALKAVCRGLRQLLSESYIIQEWAWLSSCDNASPSSDGAVQESAVPSFLENACLRAFLSACKRGDSATVRVLLGDTRLDPSANKIKVCLRRS